MAKVKKLFLAGVGAITIVSAGFIAPQTAHCKDCYTNFCTSEEWDRWHEAEAKASDEFMERLSRKQYEAFMNGHGFDDVQRAQPDVDIHTIREKYHSNW